MKGQPSPSLKVEEVVKATGGHLLRGAPGQVFCGLTTDSRSLRPGNLFIPLRGERFDGHDFILAGVGAGASGVLVQNGREGSAEGVPGDVAVILVADTLRALGDIAHYWRALFPVPLLAVTGSSGKTTTKEMIGGILSLGRKVLKTQGNFNNLVGLPLTLLEMNGAHEAVVLEMGTNQKGEIGRLAEIAAPDVGVITNIGPAHLEGFGSLEAVREEKGDLFRVMENKGIAIINCDDEQIGLISKRWDGERITFGFHHGAFVRAEEIDRRGHEGIRFILKVGDLREEVFLSAVGEHNVSNALAAAAASWAVGAGVETIRRGLEAFVPVSGRMVIRRLKNGAFLIDDSYNANPASVIEALKTLRDLKGKHRGIAVLGDMLELGDRSEAFHRGVGETAADTGVDLLFLRGDYSRAVAAGALDRGLGEGQILFSGEPGEIAAYLKSNLGAGDWVLIKGSRRMKMEEIGEAVIRAFGLHEEPSDRAFMTAGE